VSGNRYTFLATTEETNSAFSLFDFFVPPEGGPPKHVHSFEDESFYILEGQLTVRAGVEDQSTIVSPGTFVYLPQYRPHGFQNLGTTPVRVLSLTTPGGLDNFFESVGTLVTDRSAPPPPNTPEEIERVANLPRELQGGISLFPGDPIPPQEELPGYLIVPPGAPGRELVSIGGSQYTSLATFQETAGRFSLFDVSLPPQTGSGLLQRNDRQAESFYVLDGEVTFQFEEQSIVANPGTFVYFPEDTPYTFQNLGTTQARTLLLKTPTRVPEPSSWLGLLAFSTYVGASLVLKRKQKKQKLANLDTSTGTVCSINN
jgi:quercetin dioxygenase-like cupin family protein